MGIEHLHKSRYDNINDEFYTKYADVASELMNYDFEGKRVFVLVILRILLLYNISKHIFVI